LGELIHSIAVEHAPEHEVICGSKPAREKHREGETATEQQPPQALGRNVIAEMTTWSSENPNVKSKSPLPDAPNIEVVYDTSPGTTTRATHKGLLFEGLRL
jgi:hypothetical protein